MRPIDRPSAVAMFHRVVVDVRDVIFKVAFVADGVFPEAALPYGIFAMRVCGERRITLHHRARESRFDQRPRRRVVSVTIWHCPNRVQMVRQYTNRNGFNTSIRDNGTIRRTQIINAFHQHRRTTVRQRHREKVCSTRNKISSILNHCVALRSEARQGICTSNQGAGEVPSARKRKPGRASLLRATATALFGRAVHHEWRQVQSGFLAKSPWLRGACT